ncbi:MAG TPA: recombinase family protein [Lachnospiraceae bacterium]|nr:recombinase family protein [Lachnospiraceae bacterium]
MIDQAFLVGIYCRLSKEDGINKRSESIENQLAIIEQYLNTHNDLIPVDTYVDDGYTGMNYDRDAFKRMMKDIDSGRINAIITKDLSRLGRDQVETARLMKKDFIIKKVRYIAIDDHIDSYKQEQNDIIVPFRILCNDFYSQDISVKVRAALNSKRRNGEFIGAFAPYGYRKDSSNSNLLVPDPDAAIVVNRIFQMFLQGYGKMRIAKTLNQEKIPCPTEYKKSNNERYSNSMKLGSTNYWTYTTIHRILSNEVYIGNMVQHKQEKLAYNLKQHRSVPRDKYIIVPNTHVAIIDLELFERVQKLLRTKYREPDMGTNVTRYAGILHCGDCTRALSKTVHRSGLESYIYYKCGTYKQYGKEHCTSHTIREDKLDHILLRFLQEEAKRLLTMEDVEVLKAYFMQIQNGERERIAVEVADRLKALRAEKENMVRLLAKGIVTEEDYLTFQERIRMEVDHYKEVEKQTEKERQMGRERQLQNAKQLEKEPKSLGKQEAMGKLNEEQESFMNSLLDLIHIDKVTRAFLITLFEEIRVFEGKRIEITVRYREKK